MSSFIHWSVYGEARSCDQTWRSCPNYESFPCATLHWASQPSLVNHPPDPFWGYLGTSDRCFKCQSWHFPAHATSLFCQLDHIWNCFDWLDGCTCGQEGSLLRQSDFLSLQHLTHTMLLHLSLVRLWLSVQSQWPFYLLQVLHDPFQRQLSRYEPLWESSDLLSYQLRPSVPGFSPTP